MFTSKSEQYKKNKADLQQSNHQEQTATPLISDKGQHRTCCKIIIESKLYKAKIFFRIKGK